ncbi:Aquaporin-11 [Nymphon striatum]|nr:Aquaporin-11 [Nymphon striatum]
MLAYAPAGIIGLHCGILYLLRSKLSPKLSSTQAMILEEFLCTIEISCVCAELGVAKAVAGNLTFILCSIAVNMWWITGFGTATANPVVLLLNVIYNKGDVKEALLRVVGQLAAVPFALRYAKTFWFFGLLKEHSDIYNQAICQSDIQTWFLLAAILEFIITFIDTSVGKLIEPLHPEVSRFLYSTSVTFLVFSTFNFSGGYFNPILATCLTLGCAGSTVKIDLLVYWIAAVAGAISSIEVLKRYQDKKIDAAKKIE